MQKKEPVKTKVLLPKGKPSSSAVEKAVLTVVLLWSCVDKEIHIQDLGLEHYHVCICIESKLEYIHVTTTTSPDIRKLQRLTNITIPKPVGS